MKAQYMSQKMMHTEQVFHDDFREEVQKIQDQIYNKQVKRRGLIQALDRDFEKRIMTAEKNLRD